MSYATTLALINQWIIQNGLNEITANVLRPILVAILNESNTSIGDLSTLTTVNNTNLVEAINEINVTLSQISNGGIKLYSGLENPNVTPPASFSRADFYLQVDGSNNPIELFQYNGSSWVSINNGTAQQPAINKVISATLSDLGAESFADVTPALMTSYIQGLGIDKGLGEDYQFEIADGAKRQVWILRDFGEGNTADILEANVFLEVDESTADDFIPLAGTTEGNPVSGDIKFYDLAKIKSANSDRHIEFGDEGEIKIHNHYYGDAEPIADYFFRNPNFEAVFEDSVNNITVNLFFDPFTYGWRSTVEHEIPEDSPGRRKIYPQVGYVDDKIAEMSGGSQTYQQTLDNGNYAESPNGQSYSQIDLNDDTPSILQKARVGNNFGSIDAQADSESGGAGISGGNENRIAEVHADGTGFWVNDQNLVNGKNTVVRVEPSVVDAVINVPAPTVANDELTPYYFATHVNGVAVGSDGNVAAGGGTVTSVTGTGGVSVANGTSTPVIGFDYTGNAPLVATLAAKEDTANKVTTMSGNESSSTKFLSAKAVYDWGSAELNQKESLSNKTSFIIATSTADEYPSAQAVWSFWVTKLRSNLTFPNNNNVPTTQAVVNALADKVDKATGKSLIADTEITRLATMATNATANDTDANLKNRANHTGSQLASTISDFAATVRATVLTGLSTASAAVITATDTVLSALGKLQAQVSANTSAIALKADKRFYYKSNTDLVHSGTAAETPLLEIPVGTGWQSGDLIDFFTAVNRSGAGTATIRLRISSTPGAGTSGNVIATFGAANTSMPMDRTFELTGTSDIEGVTFTTSTQSDKIASSNTWTSGSFFDRTVAQYLTVTCENSDTSANTRFKWIEVKKRNLQ